MSAPRCRRTPSAIAAGTGGFVIHGEDATDLSGRSVASAGDINGDGFADVLVVASGANGHVKAFSGRDGSQMSSFFAYPDFLGSVTVSAGDFDNNGTDEIVTAGEFSFVNADPNKVLPQTSPVILIAVALGGALAGLLVGVPSLRLRGDYLAIVTLGLGEIVSILATSKWAEPLVGGPQGMRGVTKAQFLGFNPQDVPQHFYYLALIFVVLAFFVSRRLANSRIGRAWNAMREDEQVADAMGINTTRFKLLAFAMGASFGGVAGGMFAAIQGFISPESFVLVESVMIVSMVVLGGMGADTITTGVGVDTIFGDNGYVQMDVEGGKFAKWGSKSLNTTTGSLSVTDLGGSDVILTAAGDKNLVGGDGQDKITAGNGNHVVAGDNVEVTYVAIRLPGAGQALRYETTDKLSGTGGNDTLTLGNGNNVVFGGMGADEVAGLLREVARHAVEIALVVEAQARGLLPHVVGPAADLLAVEREALPPGFLDSSRHELDRPRVSRVLTAWVGEPR